MALWQKHLDDDGQYRLAIYGLRTSGVMAKGPILNWKKCPLSTRHGQAYWIRQGEDYYTAVERIQQEIEDAARLQRELGQAVRRKVRSSI